VQNDDATRTVEQVEGIQKDLAVVNGTHSTFQRETVSEWERLALMSSISGMARLDILLALGFSAALPPALSNTEAGLPADEQELAAGVTNAATPG
jgi:hypothetical protein